MGTRDHASLPEDAVPVGGHADRLAGRRSHRGEAGQEQTEAHHAGRRGETGPGTARCQICRVLCPYTGKVLIG